MLMPEVPHNLVCALQERRKCKEESWCTWFHGSNSYSCQTIVLLVLELAWVKTLQAYLPGASLQAAMLLGICSLNLLGSSCNFSAFVAVEQVPGNHK